MQTIDWTSSSWRPVIKSYQQALNITRRLAKDVCALRAQGRPPPLPTEPVCTGEAIGLYIDIHIPYDEWMTICEIEIYGKRMYGDISYRLLVDYSITIDHDFRTLALRCVMYFMHIDNVSIIWLVHCTHIRQSYLAGAGSVMWSSQCQRGNNGAHEGKVHASSLRTLKK